MEAQLRASRIMEAAPGAMDDTPRPDVTVDPESVAASALAQARAGDRQAFCALMRIHQARVYSIALRFTGRRAEAEELVQDVFVQLHGALRKIDSPAHLTHWLLRTVTHRCIDRQRHEQRRPRLVPIESMQVADAAAPEAGHDPLAAGRLRLLLLDLAPDARAVLLLRYQEDLHPAEIAATLGMSVNTVKSHLRRSLDWLRAQSHGDDHGL
jgi:RNA polymerase sigma-70 factor (ECF subfamily)